MRVLPRDLLGRGRLREVAKALGEAGVGGCQLVRAHGLRPSHRRPVGRSA